MSCNDHLLRVARMSRDQRLAEMTAARQRKKHAMPMTADDIQRGHLYRFRSTNTVYLILFEWAATEDKPREVEYIAMHHNGLGECTRRQSAEQIAIWCSCEVTAKFADVVKAEPDPRQTDVEDYAAADPFLTGLG